MHKAMCKPTCPTGEGESEWEDESGRGGGGPGGGADPLTSESSDDDFFPDIFNINKHLGKVVDWEEAGEGQ